MNVVSSASPAVGRSWMISWGAFVSQSYLSFVWVKVKKKTNPQIHEDDTGLNTFFSSLVQKSVEYKPERGLLFGQNNLWEVYQNQILPLDYCIVIKNCDPVELVTFFLVALFAMALRCSGTMPDFLKFVIFLQRKVPTSFSSNSGVLTLRGDTNHNIQDRVLCPLPSCETNLAFYETDRVLST